MVKVNWKRNNKTTKIKDKFLEDNELHQLLDYAYTKNFRYATLIEWLYLTGMRIGEALALNWDDITSAQTKLKLLLECARSPCLLLEYPYTKN